MLFFSLGNHDVLNNGGFSPDGEIGYFSRLDYLSGLSKYGYQIGIGTLADYLWLHPENNVVTIDDFFGMAISWRILTPLMILDEDWRSEIDPRFDLMALLHHTPEDPSDDGVSITPDANRKFLGTEGFIETLRPEHGFYQGKGYYRIDPFRFTREYDLPIRFLVLDTTEMNLISEGGVSETQLRWLADELEQAIQDKVLVVVASHHRSEQILINKDRLIAMMAGCPNVILHLVGHHHHNEIVPHPNPLDSGYGYWEVQNPSIISFPQQARIFEITDNRDGTGTIYSTVFDHWEVEGDDSDKLAVLGREMAFWDYAQRGYDSLEGFVGYGSADERNVALQFTIVDDVKMRLAEIPSDGRVTSLDSLGQFYR